MKTYRVVYFIVGVVLIYFLIEQIGDPVRQIKNYLYIVGAIIILSWVIYDIFTRISDKKK